LDERDLKSFTIRWFEGITSAIEAVIKKQSVVDSKTNKVKTPAKIASRGDLSKTNPKEDRKAMLLDETICFGSKGFYGTPLPLIPDIRKSEVSEGVVGSLLESFGITKKFGRLVVLHQGPNKRSNRYLVFQYQRLIKSLNGVTVKGNNSTPAHVVWSHNFYEISKMKDISAKDRRKYKSMARTYWSIAMQLLRSSRAFRIAVLKRTLGKTGRWFHRDWDILDLFDFNKMYQWISDHFSSDMKVRRTWINTEQRDGSFKWRPLGIADIPWRIFMKGLNNLLETFLSSGWPKNQHGYKSGRGVHTVWNQILVSVIYAKYILEFDFAGFFNTVKIEAVGNTLNRFFVPKYVIAYLVLLSSGDVDNISQKKMLELIKSPEVKGGWTEAWSKYEYIHKFRRGFRSIGLVQGFSLSPVLSVLTLIVLDELETQGIKNIMFADDGLFYSNKYQDFLKVAQELLDHYGIGAYFNQRKSKWIKKEGIWLTKLKFVGLVYDPFTDILSAATRNGATLELVVGTVGLFSDVFLEKFATPVFSESSHADWVTTNNKIFDIYEQIYLSGDLGSSHNKALLESLSTSITLVMKKRFADFPYWLLAEVIRDHGVKFQDFLAPFRLMKNISNELYFELTDIYEKNFDSPFPWEVVFKDPLLKQKFWMDLKYSGQDFESLYKSKQDSRALEDVKHQSLPIKLNTGSALVIDQLVWFHSQKDIPASLKSQFKANGTCTFAKWYDLLLEESNIENMPSSVVDHIKKYSSSLGYSRLTWRNLYMDPVFATFIARLYQDSFRSNMVKQNFRLTYDRTITTLVQLVYRYVGKAKFDSLLNDGKFDIFNSSSFCANLLLSLAKNWNPHVSSSKAASVPLYKRAYWAIIRKISKRRSDSDVIFTGKANHKLSFIDRQLVNKYPLIPYQTYVKHFQQIHKHVLNKHLKQIDEGLHIKTITRSAISEHELHVNLYGNEIGHKFKSVRWDTLSPRTGK
jgi:hypothetical protein